MTDISDRTGQIANDLYSTILGEQVWPHNKRIIYCAVTGAPWGQVSEDYVKRTVMVFGAKNAATLETIIERITLFNGPSPLWQSKVPSMLVQNKMIDPKGFLVYMLNCILKQEYESKRVGDLEYEIQWKRDMTLLYTQLDMIDMEYIDKLNDVLLMVSGEGYIPSTHLLPGKRLTDYCDQAKLEELARLCRKLYQRRDSHQGQYFAGQARGNRPKPSGIHAKAAEKATWGDNAPQEEKYKQAMIDLMIVDLFRAVDSSFTDAEHKKAKAKTGINSPLFSILKTHNDDTRAAKLAEAMSPQPKEQHLTQVKPGVAFKFNMAKKG